MNAKRAKQNDEDEELLHLTKILSEIHQEYFSIPDNSVIDILKRKKQIFTGLNFHVTNLRLKNKIEDYGGTLVDNLEDANYALLSKNEEFDMEFYEAGRAVIVDEIYVYECVFKLRKISVEKYILYDFSGDDKLINELLDEFELDE